MSGRRRFRGGVKQGLKRPSGLELAIDPDLDKCLQAPPIRLADWRPPA
jgi:hypothetical protein